MGDSAALATVHFSRGEYGKLLAAIEEVLVSTPLYPFAQALAAASACLAGNLAREHVTRLRRSSGSPR